MVDGMPWDWVQHRMLMGKVGMHDHVHYQIILLGPRRYKDIMQTQLRQRQCFILRGNYIIKKN